MGAAEDYATQLSKENAKLNDEIDKLKNDFNKYDKVNQYYGQDEVMLVYIQKMLTILYAVVYFIFLYNIFISDKNNFVKILWLILFATLPFVVHIVTAYLYSSFLDVVDALRPGNITRL